MVRRRDGGRREGRKRRKVKGHRAERREGRRNVKGGGNEGG